MKYEIRPISRLKRLSNHLVVKAECVGTEAEMLADMLNDKKLECLAYDCYRPKNYSQFTVRVIDKDLSVQTVDAKEKYIKSKIIEYINKNERIDKIVSRMIKILANEVK